MNVLTHHEQLFQILEENHNKLIILFQELYIILAAI